MKKINIEVLKANNKLVELSDLELSNVNGGAEMPDCSVCCNGQNYVSYCSSCHCGEDTDLR